MKDELNCKFMPPHYYKFLLNRWRKSSQGNKYVKEYVNEFNEFLNCNNILGKQSDIQVFSQFCTGLRIYLKHELCKCEITELKRAYTLIQDLDVPKLSHTFRSQNHQVPTFKSTSYQYSRQGNAQTPTYKVDTKNKSAESNAKEKSTERDFSTLSHIIKCYNCQGYGHITANCPSPFKIAIIDRVFIEAPKPDSIISPKVTLVIKEFNVVFSAVTTIFSFVAVAADIRPFPSSTLPSTPPSLLPLLPTPTVVTYFLPPLLLTPSPFLLWHVLGLKLKFSIVIQPVFDLVPRVSLPSLPRHRIDPIKRTKLELQADEPPPEIK